MEPLYMKIRDLGYDSIQSAVNSGDLKTPEDPKNPEILGFVLNYMEKEGYIEINPSEFDKIDVGDAVRYINNNDTEAGVRRFIRKDKVCSETYYPKGNNKFRVGGIVIKLVPELDYLQYRTFGGRRVIMTLTMRRMARLFVLSKEKQLINREARIDIPRMGIYKRPTKKTRFPVILPDDDDLDTVIFYATTLQSRDRFMKSLKFQRSLKYGWYFRDMTSEYLEYDHVKRITESGDTVDVMIHKKYGGEYPIKIPDDYIEKYIERREKALREKASYYESIGKAMPEMAYHKWAALQNKTIEREAKEAGREVDKSELLYIPPCEKSMARKAKKRSMMLGNVQKVGIKTKGPRWRPGMNRYAYYYAKNAKSICTEDGIVEKPKRKNSKPIDLGDFGVDMNFPEGDDIPFGGADLTRDFDVIQTINPNYKPKPSTIKTKRKTRAKTIAAN